MGIFEQLKKTSEGYNFFAVLGSGGLPGISDSQQKLCDKNDLQREFQNKKIPIKLLNRVYSLFEEGVTHHKNGIDYANRHDEVRSQEELLLAKHFYFKLSKIQFGDEVIDIISNSYSISFNVYMLFCAFGKKEDGQKYKNIYDRLKG